MNELNTCLASFFETILSDPAGELSQKIHHISLPEIADPNQVSLQNHQLFWAAKVKLRSAKDVPLSIQAMMKRIERAVLKLDLSTSYPINSYWQDYLGNDAIEVHSKVNEMIADSKQSKLFPNIFIAANLLATSWLGGRKLLSGIRLDASYFDEIVSYFSQISTFLSASDEKRIRVKETMQFFQTLLLCVNKAITRYDQFTEQVSIIQIMVSGTAVNQDIFIPAGWMGTNKGRSPDRLMAIQIVRTSENTCDVHLFGKHKQFLPASKHDQFYPCLTWKQVSFEKVCCREFLEVLIEPFAAPKLAHRKDYTYNELWVIGVLNRFLGKYYESTHTETLIDWASSIDLDHSDYFSERHNLDEALAGRFVPTEAPKIKRIPLMGAAGSLREMKVESYGNGVDKLLHTVVAVLLGDRQDYKQWKIEQRLYCLVHLYECLKNQLYPSNQVRDLIETFEKAESNLWSALSKQALSGDDETLAQLRTHAATLLDVKIRFQKWRKHSGIKSVLANRSPFTPKILPFCAVNSMKVDRNDASVISLPSFTVSVSPVTIAPENIMDLNLGNLKKVRQWLDGSYQTARAFLQTHRSSEWLAFFQDEIGRYLLIPTKETPCWQLDQISDAHDVQNVMKSLYALSNLLLYQARQEEQILPWHLLHVFTIYRIQLELMCQLVPELRAWPISWCHFKEMMDSRGQDLYPQELAAAFERLQQSFNQLSSQGSTKGPIRSGDKETYALFDTSWGMESKPCEKGDSQRVFFIDLILYKLLGIEKGSLYSGSCMQTLLSICRRSGLKPEHSSFAYFLPYGEKIKVMPFYYLSNSAQIAQMAACKKPQADNFEFWLNGPDDLVQFQMMRLSKGWQGIYWSPSIESSNQFRFEEVYRCSMLPKHKIHSKQELNTYQEIVDDAFKLKIYQFVSQAQILKSLDKNDQSIRELTLIAQGPSNLCLDHLLSYTEVRRQLLFNEDFQGLFFSLCYSSNLLDHFLAVEPSNLDRITTLYRSCLETDLKHLTDSIHQKRFYFILECVIQLNLVLKSNRSLEQMNECVKMGLINLLEANDRSKVGDISLFILALFALNDLQRLTLSRLTKIVFCFGTHQNSNPNQTHLRILASQKLKQLVPYLIARISGSPDERRSFLKELFGDEADRWADLPLIELNNAEYSGLVIQLKDLQNELSWLVKHKKAYEDFKDYKDMEHATAENIRIVEGQMEQLIVAIRKAAQPVEGTTRALFISNSNVLIRENDLTIELDLVRGLCYRNGIVEMVGMLPPEVQTFADFTIFRHIPKQTMGFCPVRKRYLPTLCLKKDLTFSINPNQAFLTHNGKDYLLLPNPLNAGIRLPLAFQQGMSVWKSQSSDTCIVCFHEKDGYPIPAFGITQQGQYYDLTNPDWVLAEERGIVEAIPFTRLGYDRFQLLLWIDRQHRLRQIDLPFYFRNQRLSFSKNDKGQWQLNNSDLVLAEQQQTVKGFNGDDFYLIVKDAKNQPFLLIPQMNTEILREAYYTQNSTPLWGSFLNGSLNLSTAVYQLDDNGWLTGTSVADRLFLAYVYVTGCVFAKAIDLLRMNMRPIGRAYFTDELDYILLILENAKGEMSGELCAIRLYMVHQLIKHLREFPLETKKLSQETSGRLEPYLDAANKEFDKVNGIVVNLFAGYLKSGIHERSCDLRNLFYRNELEEFVLLLGRINTTVDQVLNYLTDPKTEKMTCSYLTEECYHQSRFCGIPAEEFIYNLGNAIFNAKQQEIPIESLKWKTVPHIPIKYFRRAYELIISRNENNHSSEEYLALTTYLKNFVQLTSRTISHTQPFWGGSKAQMSDVDILPWYLLVKIYEKSMHSPEIVWPVIPPHLNPKHKMNPSHGPHNDLFDDFSKRLLAILEIDFEKLKAEFVGHISSQRSQIYITYNNLYSVDHTYVKKFHKGITPSLDVWLQKHSRARIREEIATEVPVLDQTTLSLLCGPKLGDPEKIRELEHRLLESMNQLPNNPAAKWHRLFTMMGSEPPRTLDECIGLALSQKSADYPSSESLHLMMAYLLSATEKQYHDRLKLQEEKCQRSDSRQEDREMLAQLKESKRAYLPSLNALPFVCHEYYADQRLRQDQVELIQLMIKNPGDERIAGKAVQMIMGGGKTKVLALIIALYFSRGNNLALFVVPYALFGTVKEDFAQAMWKRFRRKVDVFMFRRDDCTLDRLHLLADKLMRAQQEGTILITRPKDIHAFNLMFKERVETERRSINHLKRCVAAWIEKEKLHNPEGMMEEIIRKNAQIPGLSIRQSLELSNWIKMVETHETLFAHFQKEKTVIATLQNVLQLYGKFLYDEVSSTFDPHNQVSFPVGYQISSNKAAHSMTAKIYFRWLPQIEPIVRLETNEQNYLEDIGPVIDFLVERAWDECKQELHYHVKPHVFAIYVKMAEDHHPLHQNELEQFYLLLKSWNEGPNVHKRELVQQISFLRYALGYGLKGAFKAVAHENYGRSKERKEFKLVIPYECSNTPKEGNELKHFYETALKTGQYYRFTWDDPDLTKEIIRLGFFETKHLPTSAISKAFQLIFPKDLTLDMLESPVKIRELTQYFSDCLKESSLEIKMAACLLAETHFTRILFPQQLKIESAQLNSNPQDLAYIGRSIDGFGGTFTYSDTWPQNLMTHKKEETLKQIQHVLSQPCNGKCTLIDTSTVALMMQGLFHIIKPTNCAVLDVGGLFNGVVSNRQVAEALLEKFPERKGILYFEQTGNGMTQIALLTSKEMVLLSGSDHATIVQVLKQHHVDNPLTFYDQHHVLGVDIPQPHGSTGILLLSGRVGRDILFQAALRLRLLLKGLQFVEYVIPKIMGEDIAWNFDQVLRVTTHFQTEMERHANFPAIIEQMKGYMRGQLDKTSRSVEMIEEEALDFILETQEEDMFKEFGVLQKKQGAHEALESVLKELPVEKLFVKSSAVRNELQLIYSTHLKKGTVLPDYVYRNQRFMGDTQEVDISSQTQRMQQEETQRQKALKTPVDEIAWLDLNAESIGASPFWSTCQEARPPLYSLNAALADRGYPGIFDNRLLISRNLLVTFHGVQNTLFTEHQKSIHYVLIVAGSKGYQVILVSIGDAQGIKKIIHHQRSGQVWLLEPNGQLIAGGSTSLQITPELRLLLLQTMIIQGDALHLSQQDLQPLKAWIHENRDRTMVSKEIFETALNGRDNDFSHYLQNIALRDLFLPEFRGT